MAEEVGKSGGAAERMSLEPFNFEQLREIIQLCRENDIAELTIQQHGTKISVKRGVPVVSSDVALVRPAPAIASAPEAAVAQPVAAAQPPAEAEGEKHVTITSPMVGTFYRAAAPDAAPFVEVDDPVKENSILCIIEAMKLMNEIKAETKGIVAKILVENGQPVEYGQPLFLIKPE